MAIERVFLAFPFLVVLGALLLSPSYCRASHDIAGLQSCLDASSSTGFSLCSDDLRSESERPSISEWPLILATSTTVPAADDLDALQARFDRETDGGQKVKALKQLAEALVQREREASRAGDYSTVGLTLEKYRDNIKAAFEALKRTHPNAVKKPGGYKRLEFENQKAMREVRDLLLTVPEEYKPPLQIVQTDLLAIENDLLHALFPDRPGEKPLPSQTDKPGPSPAPQEEKQP